MRDLAVALFFALLPLSVLGNPVGYPKTLFLDQFHGTAGSKPDPTNAVGTGEVQTYTAINSNVRLTGANTLLITPIQGSNGVWTSGRIETLPMWDFRCGAGSRMLMEATIRLGNNTNAHQLGIWPAFWTLGSVYRINRWSWPSIGEIDIMETVNGLPTVWQTNHCGVDPGGPCNEPNGIQASTTATHGVWHTFGVQIDRTKSNWLQQTITWYINSTSIHAVTGANVNNQTYWTRLNADPKFMLLNVAVGGAFPNGVSGRYTPTAATLGGSGSAMEVSYAGVYST